MYITMKSAGGGPDVLPTDTLGARSKATSECSLARVSDTVHKHIDILSQSQRRRLYEIEFPLLLTQRPITEPAQGGCGSFSFHVQAYLRRYGDVDISISFPHRASPGTSALLRSCAPVRCSVLKIDPLQGWLSHR